MVILEVTALVLLESFLVQIALWAWVFILCGEFTVFEHAFFHSAVNYTTLGYGDVVMSERWRCVGPEHAPAEGFGMVRIGRSCRFLQGRRPPASE